MILTLMPYVLLCFIAGGMFSLSLIVFIDEDIAALEIENDFDYVMNFVSLGIGIMAFLISLWGLDKKFKEILQR